MDTFDQLHVVSDLHLGGVPGHQIFNQGEALAAVIDHLARLAARQRVGFVLNGDIVDFLAAEGAAYFDAKGAAKKLEAVFDDDAFKPVWDALARYTAVERAVLVLVLGNHDVELALPAVTEQLLGRICQDTAARSRVRLAMDGWGYTCEVGDRTVHCTHGNQVDPWNPIDYDALRHASQAHTAGREQPPWEPNAGTRLVIDVMNGIKEEYAFVDLLKPETVPVPAVLVALPTDQRASLGKFARIAVRRLYDQGRLATGLLSVEPGKDVGASLDKLSDEQAIELLARPSTWEPVDRNPMGWTGLDWLRQAVEDARAGRRPVDLVDVGAGETLGFGGLVMDRLRGRDPRDNLREALASYLASDRSFRFDTEDDAFTKLDASAGNADCLIAGHTHLARRLARRQAMGVYFNSGTWIRLIQLTPSMLTTRGFDKVYDALRSGSLEALDGIPDLVLQRRTVVAVWTEDDVVRAELRSALPAPPAGAPPEDPPWRSELGTQYTFARRGEAMRREPAGAST